MASVKSPLMTAAAQGGHGAHGPGVGSAPGPTAGLGSQPDSSGYFSQPYLLHPQPAAPQQTSHLPARSPYTESQNFMPSTQQALPVDDEKTYLNTIANSRSQTHLPSSVAATGGNTPVADSLPYQSNADAAGSEAGPNIAANTMANNYNHTNSRFAENWDASQRGSSVLDADGSAFGDGASVQLPARSNTLKKKASMRRSASLHRSSSRRSMTAGSVRSLALQSRSDSDESHSAFYCPVPTKGNPTEVLSNRFQAWRKILKDLISYHREIQNHYEQRAKSLQRLSTNLNGSTLPPGFIPSGGLDDAAQMLRNFHKQAVAEAIKAREVEEDIILALTGLRSDLSQKIKEIKNISGDFKNNVDKEMDATKKAVKNLQDNLGQAEVDTSLTTGRQDPYLLRLVADRQLERQIQEENYLHQAFLNLERSGRELESIVVGEIQKSYNAYVGVLRREASTTLATVDELRKGPIAMPKDEEWLSFIRSNDQFIDPEVPIRSFQFVSYPGQNHYAAQEIRAGLLERKSRYLKSYTAGWYVLSPTHLHEFKSGDKMQAPIMSLYLPEQKLGSHSTESASSSKFVLKGRQTGGLHRGHTWVFRAESYDAMKAWFDDIHALTETSPQEREDFARGKLHTRSASRASQHTYSSDGVVHEDDDEPFAANSPAAIAGVAAGARAAEEGLAAAQLTAGSNAGGARDVSAAGAGADTRALGLDSQSQYRSPSMTPSRRPSQGGRFPSDLQVNAQRGLEVQAAGVPVSPTSAAGSGSHQGSGHGSEYGVIDYGVIAAAGGLPGSYQQPAAPNSYGYAEQQPQSQVQQPPYQQQPQQQTQYSQPPYQQAQFQQPQPAQQYHEQLVQSPQEPYAKQYTSQAAVAAQARQAPTTVAPVIPMFVNITADEKNPGAVDRGRDLDDGTAALTNGNSVSAANGVSGYAREQAQVYAAAETRPPPNEAQAALGGQPRQPLVAETSEAPYITTPVLEKTNRLLNGGSGGGVVDNLSSTKPTSEPQPDPSPAPENEVVTLANLHIPGQYPRSVTETK